MKTAEEILKGKLTCTCYEAYKIRKMADPDCALCENTSEIVEAMEEYASQFIHQTNCIQCEGTGNIVISINPDGQDYTQTCMNCKGVGKVIMLPMQPNT